MPKTQDKPDPFAQLILDYEFVFRTDAGGRVLRDIMRQAHMFETTFDPDPVKMAFLNGERNSALKILSMLKDRTDVEDHMETQRFDYGLHLHHGA